MFRVPARVVVVTFTSLLLAAAAAAAPVCTELTVRALGAHGGRTYTVCHGEALPAGPLPLMLGLHGATLNAKEMISKQGGDRMNELAEERGFLAVYPDGTCPEGWRNAKCRLERGFHWNDCRADNEKSATVADDVDFLRHLVETELARQGYAIDPTRVYAWGGSNGGLMTLRLAHEAPELLAGIAVVNASEPAASKCVDAPLVPVDTLFMRGTGDPYLPYDGGNVTSPTAGEDREEGYGTIVSTDETLARWAARNRCDAEPGATVHYEDIVRNDGPGFSSSTVERETWSGCDDGAEVTLLRVVGGGHRVPGTGGGLSSLCFNNDPSTGCANMDIHGADEIWAFLSGETAPSEPPGPIVNPDSFSVNTGALLSGNRASLLADDDDRVVVVGPQGFSSRPAIEVRFAVRHGRIDALRVELVSSDSQAGIPRRVSAWSFASARWESLGGDLVGRDDKRLEVTTSDGPFSETDDYLGPDGEVRILVEHRGSAGQHDMLVDAIRVGVNE